MDATRKRGLIEHARRRGKELGEHRYMQGVLTRTAFPPRSTLEREIRGWIVDLLPLDEVGEELLDVCYEAARDAYNRLRKGSAW